MEPVQHEESNGHHPVRKIFPETVRSFRPVSSNSMRLSVSGRVIIAICLDFWRYLFRFLVFFCQNLLFSRFFRGISDSILGSGCLPRSSDTPHSGECCSRCVFHAENCGPFLKRLQNAFHSRESRGGTHVMRTADQSPLFRWRQSLENVASVGLEPLQYMMDVPR